MNTLNYNFHGVLYDKIFINPEAEINELSFVKFDRWINDNMGIKDDGKIKFQISITITIENFKNEKAFEFRANVMFRIKKDRLIKSDIDSMLELFAFADGIATGYVYSEGYKHFNDLPIVDRVPYDKEVAKLNLVLPNN